MGIIHLIVGVFQWRKFTAKPDERDVVSHIYPQQQANLGLKLTTYVW